MRTLLSSHKMAALLGPAALLVAAPARAQEEAAPAPPCAALDACFVTLGTAGGPRADRERSQPANAFVSSKGILMFDTGDGAAGRLAATGHELDEIDAVFLSHLHFDHIAGLFGVIGLRYALDIRAPLTVYGPVGAAELVAGLFAASQPTQRTGYGVGDRFADLAGFVTVVELADGEAVEALPGVTVRAVGNSHFTQPRGGAAEGAQSLSYRIDTARRSIVYSGDTGPSDALTRLAEGADLLVTEIIDLEAIAAAMEADPQTSVPRESLAMITRHLALHHLTANQIAEMARTAGVGSVVLTHLVPALPAGEAERVYAARVREGFAGPVVVAEDGRAY